MNNVKRELDQLMGEERFNTTLKDRILKSAMTKQRRNRIELGTFKWQYLLASIAVVIGLFLIGTTFISPNQTITADVPEANPKTMEEDLLAFSRKVINTLGQHDYELLSTFIHPNRGLFFSFYADVENPTVVLSSKEVAQLIGNEEYLWGVHHMTEEQFTLSVNDYIDTFLLRHYLNPNLSKPVDYSVIEFNEVAAPLGGIINTIHDYYPNAKFVEYYSSDEDIEWQAIRFVYEEVDGKWYLIGIVRDVHSP